MAFEQAGPVDQLWDGEMAARLIGGRKVLLVRMGESIRAYEDRCAHLGLPLSDGLLAGQTITCSAHHYEYDAMTGRGINPRAVCLMRFPVKVEEGAIWVDVAAGFRDAGDGRG